MDFDDKRDPRYWRSIKPDSTLTITDEQSLEEAGIKGAQYLVKQVFTIDEMSDICQWLFFRLASIEASEDDIWMLVKIVDQELDIRLYAELHDSFESGNREDMFDHEQQFVFQEPENPDDFEWSDLKYAACVEWDFDKDDHVDYNVKTGEMQGTVKVDPRESGQKNWIATIVEFDTSDETHSPELLFLEIGSPSVEEGGLIRMMFGNPIKPTEVDVLAVTAQ